MRIKACIGSIIRFICIFYSYHLWHASYCSLNFEPAGAYWNGLPAWAVGAAASRILFDCQN